ncbi:MAG: ELWxxDGT repeat protein [Planctomycetota bacterium]
MPTWSCMRLVPAAACLVALPALIAQQPVLVQDINRTSAADSPSDPTEFVEFNGDIYFAATRPDVGTELFKTTRQPGTVELVKDIRAGAPSSEPQGLTVFRGELFFQANDSALRLWKTDGTEAGTVRVTAADPASTPSVWRTDGTAAGTIILSQPILLWEAAAYQGAFFFAGQTAGVRQLWRSDGSPAGTGPVKQVEVHDLLVVGGDLWFAGEEAGTRDLWISDGTAAGTQRVAPSVGLTNVGSLVAVRGDVCFSASTSLYGAELWTSDGTAAGTRLMSDILPGARGSLPRALTPLGADLFFAADQGPTGHEPFRSDGTAAGTVLLENVSASPTAAPNVGSSPGEFVELYGTTLFAADDGVAGRELWRTDGTERGTARVADLLPGPLGADPRGLIRAGNTVFFTATDTPTRTRLWQTDGSTAGTTPVKDIVPSPTRGAAAVGEILFFVASDASAGRELWQSDGTPGGTRLVKDITPGAAGTDLCVLESVAGRVFFVVNAAPRVHDLWSSDGTATGTQVVASTVAGAPHAAYRGKLFFAGSDPATGAELWASDGTVAGTALVADMYVGVRSSNPDHLTVAGEQLFFTAQDLVAGIELWKSDGTAAGTALVRDLQVGGTSSDPEDLTAWGDVVMFEATNALRRALWRSDGTAAGTQLLANAFSAPLGETGLDALTPGGSRRLYFAGRTPTSGQELWRTDGTAAGTQLVADLLRGTASSTPRGLTLSNGRVLFAATDNVVGRELWAVHPGATAQPVGESCADPAQLLRLAAGDPALGALVQIRVLGALPGTAGALLLGPPSSAVAVGSGCSLYLNPAGLATLAPIVASSSAWAVSVRLPTTPELTGVRTSLQAILGPTPAPLGADLTNAVFWTLGR